MKLQDRVAIITGGAMGIGAATAQLFASEGASVVIGDIADADAQKVVASIHDRGGRATFGHADLRRPQDVEYLIALAAESFGGLDVLVNNAGVALAKSTTETTLEEWERVIGINLTGAWLCARAAIPLLIGRGGGAIVNVASNAGLVGFANLAAYCASKGGMVQLTKAMALDCAPHHIRVNAICPGHTRTPMGDGFVAAQRDPKAFVKEFVNVQHPIGRMAEPEEVARGILFLACDDSSFITGSILAADGGYTAH
jgi:meso-butanediol dehydrogenase / (S,S)-butanediol dehydrogenase / diacetyl reductase